MRTGMYGVGDQLCMCMSLGPTPKAARRVSVPGTEMPSSLLPLRLSLIICSAARGPPKIKTNSTIPELLLLPTARSPHQTKCARIWIHANSAQKHSTTKSRTIASTTTADRRKKNSWDEAYTRELTNHQQDASDEGTIWFDDSGAEEKVLERLETLEEEGLLVKDDENDKPASRILDLGTGNGHMVFSLAEEGWTGELVGVDYSEASVQLALQIAARKREEADEPEDLTLRFEKWDLLNEQPGEWLGAGFDAVLDKGTFDAISLSDETDDRGRRICEYYREKVIPLVKKRCFFIITSCNWTKEELLHWFVTPDGDLEFFDEAKYPTFTFGGQQGQSVCTLIFQRR